MRTLGTFGVILAIAASTLLGSASPAAAQGCGGSNHLVSAGHSGLVILRERDISCRTVQRIGQALLRQSRPARLHRPVRVEGFSCRGVVMRGGQHAVSCAGRRHQFVLFGLE